MNAQKLKELISMPESEKLDFKLHPLLHTTYYRKQLRIQILKNVYS